MDAAHQSEERLVPLHDQAAVDQETDRWAIEWAESAPYHCTFVIGDGEYHLEPLDADKLRAAALTFPIHTGLGGHVTCNHALLRGCLMSHLMPLHACCMDVNVEAIGVLVISSRS